MAVFLWLVLNLPHISPGIIILLNGVGQLSHVNIVQHRRENQVIKVFTD